MTADLATILSDLRLGEVRYLDSLASTNDFALAWASENPPDFSLVIADEQTSGRGRMGRKWFTPSGAGLALSVILRLNAFERDKIALFSGLGALALVDALKTYDIAAKIKWPNDVLIKRKKVAGILVEVNWLGSDVEALVLGIGVNITPQAIPPDVELNFPATCAQAETFLPLERFGLLRALLKCLLEWRLRLGSESFLRAWQSSLAFCGETVQVFGQETEPVVGIVDGIETDGSLRLIVNGEPRLFHFGEIRLRPV